MAGLNSNHGVHGDCHGTTRIRPRGTFNRPAALDCSKSLLFLCDRRSGCHSTQTERRFQQEGSFCLDQSYWEGRRPPEAFLRVRPWRSPWTPWSRKRPDHETRIRYPVFRTVRMCCGSPALSSSLRRSSATCVSTVRLYTSPEYPHTSSSSSARDATWPRR